MSKYPPLPPPNPSDPETRLLRAIFGACPDCDNTEPHEHETRNGVTMPITDRGDWDLFGDIARINHWIESANGRSQHEDSMRVMKVGEEYGEAVAAYIGMTGQNPRKGVTHTSLDLLRELADVAITALCAMEHFTGSDVITRSMLASKVTEIIDRAGISPTGVYGPRQSPEQT